MRCLLIGCEVLLRELADAIAHSPHTIDVEFLPKSLRDIEQLALGAGTDFTLDDLIAKYGEDNGQYLYDELRRYERSYRQLTFIETGLEPDGRFEQQARVEAAEKNWQFEKICGDLSLIRKLVGGDWDPADFLVVEPGGRIVASYDEGIIKAERMGEQS